MAIATVTIAALSLLMLAFIILLFLLLCKPWRLFLPLLFFSTADDVAAARSVKDDIERPLVDDEDDSVSDGTGDSAANSRSSPSLQNEGNASRAGVHDRAATDQGGSLVLDIVSGSSSEDLLVGQTLKRSAVVNWPTEDKIYLPKKTIRPVTHRAWKTEQLLGHGSCLTVEVVAGPSSGFHCTLHSTNESQLPLTLGRVPPCGLLFNDSEVSGKHAMINWNSSKLKWELTDMGSLNGTQLNSKPINFQYSGCRHSSEPVELADGDIITLGMTSALTVHITSYADTHIPFGVGMASDPMEMRRGKKLPMEDTYYYQWPLPAAEQFGLFGVFDGHGGEGAAITAREILPKVVAEILSIKDRRERVLSFCDASEVLREAFFQTEAATDHECEGCTATVLLIWANQQGDLFAQCANVGDSACIMNIGDKHTMMSQDHRITSLSERTRLMSMGSPIQDGETRLCGLNIARMLGDKFLKEQEPRFSSEPYVSRSVHIPHGTEAFALLASDGLWDVISAKRVVQLVVQARERYEEDKYSAEKVANFVLNEARSSRTRDNTTIIFLDFNTKRTASCN